jgi:hypothetical protein
MKYEILGVTRLIGILEPNTGRIKTEILLIDLLKHFKNYKKYVKEGTTVMTDGHVSYTKALEQYMVGI